MLIQCSCKFDLLKQKLLRSSHTKCVHIYTCQVIRVYNENHIRKDQTVSPGMYYNKNGMFVTKVSEDQQFFGIDLS